MESWRMVIRKVPPKKEVALRNVPPKKGVALHHVFLLYMSKTRCNTDLWPPYQVIQVKSTGSRCLRLASTLNAVPDRPHTVPSGKH
jgi:hypothetical protein